MKDYQFKNGIFIDHLIILYSPIDHSQKNNSCYSSNRFIEESTLLTKIIVKFDTDNHFEVFYTIHSDYVDVHYTLNDTVHIIHIDFRNMIVDRLGTLFSGEELKFYDNYGFDLSERYKNITKSHIDDWWLWE